MTGQELGILLKMNRYGKYSVAVVAVNDGKVTERNVSVEGRDRAMTSAFKIFREETDRLAQSLSRGKHQFDVKDKPDVELG